MFVKLLVAGKQMQGRVLYAHCSANTERYLAPQSRLNRSGYLRNLGPVKGCCAEEGLQ